MTPFGKITVFGEESAKVNINHRAAPFELKFALATICVHFEVTPGVFQFDKEQQRFTSGGFESIDFFTVEQFNGRSVIGPNVPVLERSCNQNIREHILSCEENVPGTGCWIVEPYFIACTGR